MSTEPGRTSSRFRSGSVNAPTTDVERLERMLGDGERLYELYRELAVAAITGGDIRQVLELASVAARAEDPDRAYGVRKFTAQLFLGAVRAQTSADPADWAPLLDATVELLTPALDANPHEPELLNLLGLAVYELGHVSLARRLFEAIREIEPSHQQARAHLRACKDRAQRGGVRPVAEALTPFLTHARTHVKTIADRATRLAPKSISLCMIVKDEEEMLPGCLAAVAEHVDQLVIVDTGSTDRTREIALEYGAEVHEFPWNGSFADARNESLRHATGDWVLYLDADEHLVEEDAGRLHELARKTWIEGFHLVETHYTGLEDHGAESTHAPMRMFQRRDKHQWRGRVHEQIMTNFPAFLEERLQHTTVRVNHYGYLAVVIADRDKRSRNLELLMTQLDERRDAFTCFNIGTEYAAMGDHTAARPWFEEAYAGTSAEPGWQDRQFAPMLVQRTITSRRENADLIGSIQLANEALTWWPAFTDLVYERALAHSYAADWPQTIEQARRAIAMGDAPARFVSTAGKGSFQARALLAKAHIELGELAAARDELTTAVREAPHFLTTTTALADLLVRTTPHQAAADTIDELIGDAATSASASMLLGAVFHEAGAFPQAQERYERVLTAHPDHAGALIARAELRLALGEIRSAYDSAIAVDPLHPMAGRSGRTAFLAAVVLAELGGELLDEPGRRIADDESLAASERATYVAWRARLNDGSDNVSVLVPADAHSAATVFTNLEALAKLEATDAFERLYPLTSVVLPDARSRRIALAELYLRQHFADLAAEQLMLFAQEFGPTPAVLTMLGKVATIKELWDEASTFLEESLQLDPAQPQAERLLAAVRDRVAG